MTATQVLCDAFGYLSSGEPDCPYDGCGDCPIHADGTFDGVSCQSTFAKLLIESRLDPWDAERREFNGRCYCSLCGCPVDDGDERCPMCGALLG